MDHGNNTYLQIKESYRKENIIIGVFNAVIGLYFLNVFRKIGTPVSEAGLRLRFIFLAVCVLFISSGVIGVLIRNSKWNKMLQTLGCMSDEEAQWKMAHARPLYRPVSPYIVPRYYILDDRIVNFATFKTYEIRKIVSINKRENINFKNGRIIDITISDSPYRDKIAMRIREERDMIYDSMASAVKSLRVNDNLEKI